MTHNEAAAGRTWQAPEEVRLMRSKTLRFAAFLAATTITITGLQTVTAPAPARAERQDTDFTLSVFPVGSQEVRFRDGWGEWRSGGRRHRGTDIVADRGTPILAVANGVVTKMDYQYQSGFYLVIDHGNGTQTMYLHLNNDTYGTDDGQGGVTTAYYPTLTVGTEVQAGDVIGYIGDTGNAEETTPNTHCEISTNGEKINPYPLLEAAFEREERNLPPLVTPF